MHDYSELRKLVDSALLGECYPEYSSLLSKLAYNRAVSPEAIAAILDELDALRKVAEVVERFTKTFGHSESCATELGDEDEPPECDCGTDWFENALANWRKVTEGSDAEAK